MNDKTLKYEVLQSSRLFDEREEGKIHTPYEIENAFYSTIKRGNVKEMKAMLKTFMDNKLILGKLSNNSFRQIQYWAVCCITIATRYAISGGLDETTAFNFSDECIMKIDSLSSEEEIFKLLVRKSEELTLMVKDSKVSLDYPKAVRKCLSYINTNLYTPLTLQTLSAHCGISRDHLSLIFKKSLGITIPQYIKKERLKEAKEFLSNGMTISETAYTVGFSSDSYFIKCFKEEYGITPKSYIKTLNI